MNRLTAGVQVFNLRANAQHVGTLTGTLTRANGAWKYVETTVVSGSTQQTTTLRFTAAGEMLSVNQSATTPAGAASIDVAFSAGHAKGTARMPNRRGAMQSVKIDTAVARFAIDYNAIQPFASALPLAAGSKTVARVFSSGDGASTDMTFAVVGEESVTVPLGTFDAWRVDVTGAVHVVLHVAKAAPYQLLKLSPVGSQTEIVRAK
ncbi:MAG TPA: hypothetical protein VJR92_03360 [Gemmatimonadaceae bacterium]|nr:hypothetical protein [Gemmatimonadaceae bacterium]